MKMKNRTLIGIVCIILAVAVTFLVSPLVNRISEQKTDVIRFTKDISLGSKITETDIEIVKLSKNSVPEKALKTKDAVVGKYAKADLFKGDLATEIKITDDENSVANVFSSLNGDKVAMSVTINTFAGGLSGKLENGDIVSIYVTDKEGKTTVPSELKYVKVITTTTSGGVDETEVVENEDGSFELPSTITLLVSSKQATVLANYEENASMHVALVFRGDTEKAQKFLDKQDKFLETKTEKEGADNNG